MTAPSRFALKLEDGVFTAPVAGLRLPDREFLVGEYVLGGTEAATIKNHADPATPMTVQGTPIYNANSVTVRSSLTVGYGFRTNIVPDEEHTLIVVRKNATIATSARVVGMTGVSGGFWGARQFGADNYFSMSEGANNQGAKRTIPVGAATVYFEAGAASVRDPQLLTGGLATMYYYSAGVQQTAISDTLNTTARSQYINRFYSIGTMDLSDTVTTNNLEVFFVALYNKPLTAAGIDEAYQNVVAYYDTLGVTVV